MDETGSAVRLERNNRIAINGAPSLFSVPLSLSLSPSSSWTFLWKKIFLSFFFFWFIFPCWSKRARWFVLFLSVFMWALIISNERKERKRKNLTDRWTWDWQKTDLSLEGNQMSIRYDCTAVWQKFQRRNCAPRSFESISINRESSEEEINKRKLVNGDDRIGGKCNTRLQRAKSE